MSKKAYRSCLLLLSFLNRVDCFGLSTESMRKLASVRKVANLIPIPEADRIEVAVVDGWKCVVKKGEVRNQISESDIRFSLNEPLRKVVLNRADNCILRN